jgi:hypothetical protein
MTGFGTARGDSKLDPYPLQRKESREQRAESSGKGGPDPAPFHPSPYRARKIPGMILLPFLRLLYHLGANVSRGAFTNLVSRRCQCETPQLWMIAGGATPLPSVGGSPPS